MEVFIFTLKLQDCPSTRKSPASLLFSLLEGEWVLMGEILRDIWFTGLVTNSRESWGLTRRRGWSEKPTQVGLGVLCLPWKMTPIAPRGQALYKARDASYPDKDHWASDVNCKHES